MKVCGVEITTNEVFICLLSHDHGVFTVPDCRQRSITSTKNPDTAAIRGFYAGFNKLMEDYSVDEVVIIERPLKGKLAGSTLGFKLETAIQLIEMPVSIITPSTIKEQLKRNRINIPFEGLGLKKFQQQAFNAAYAYQSQLLFQNK